jgi:hypothetical protein
VKKYFFHIPFICLTFSCSTETTAPEKPVKEKKTDVDSIKPSADFADTLTEKEIVLKPVQKIPFQHTCDSFITAYKDNYNEKENEKRHVLMRFKNNWMKQITLHKKFKVMYGENEVNPIAYLGFYEYADSSQRANAYSNWLACFGSDCSQIIPGEEIQIKSTPGFYIINEKEIITLDYPLEHEKNNWAEMKKNLKVLFANTESIIIDVLPHGKVKWAGR